MLDSLTHSNRLWLPDVGARAVALVQSNDAPILSAWPYVIPRQSFEEAQVQACCRRHSYVSKPCKHPAQLGKEASGLRIFFSPTGLGVASLCSEWLSMTSSRSRKHPTACVDGELPPAQQCTRHPCDTSPLGLTSPPRAPELPPQPARYRWRGAEHAGWYSVLLWISEKGGGGPRLWGETADDSSGERPREERFHAA